MSDLAQCPVTLTDFRCPGEPASISRAVHLGRLARFYPACRRCPHREETGTLSGRLVKRLTETRRRGESRPLWDGEAAVGVYGNELKPSLARQLAAALGLTLLDETHDSGQPPAAIIAGDGRPLVPELLAAVSEGLRWSGCNVVDIGAASAACLAFAIGHLRCAGGIHLGNPAGRAETVGLRLWTSGPRPLSSAGPPEPIFARIEAGLNRPTRKFGSLGRFQVDEPYLAALRPLYHALRPLRFVLDAPCRPLAGYLQRLTATVACEPLPCPARDQLPEQVRRESAHFGVRLDADGETCQLWDEHGRPVDCESLLLLLAAESAARTGEPVAPGEPGRVVVVEEATSASTVRRLRRQGHRVVACPALRAEIYDACRESRAILGGGPSGRFWHAWEEHVVADALVSLTLLLGRLSRSDRTLSQVLDAEGQRPKTEDQRASRLGS
jgi:phosphomannomutase